jgi:hypothetical protein
MAKDFIGVLVSADTDLTYAVINPDDDSELDNPRWLLLRGEKSDALRMVKVPRDQYMGAQSMDDLARIIAALR